MSSLSVTNFAALTSAVGRELNDLGGLRMTRLIATTSAGSSTLVVEHSFDWPAPAGKISIDGVTYHYTGNDLNGNLSGIYVVVGGVQIANTQVQHNFNATIIDVSQTASALDQVREALLVGYASGDDLTAIGRNLGVPRAPTIKSDAQFRNIVQAMAYNPQATIYGLSLVLNAIVGNTTISGATTVTAGSAILANVPVGAAVGQTVTGTGIPVNTAILAVYGTSATMSANATTSGMPTLSYSAPNWSISEDLVNSPCQLTVTIPGSYFLNTVPQGQAYMTASTTLLASGGTLANYNAATGQSYARASSITLSPVNLTTSTRSARPSADTQAFTPKATAGTAIWTYVGTTTETAAVVANSVSGVQVGYRLDYSTTTQPAYYRQALPVISASYASISAVTQIAYQLIPQTNFYDFLSLNDGTVSIQLYAYNTGTTYYIGMRSGSGGAALAYISVNPGTYFTSFTEYRLHKRSNIAVDMIINGIVILTVPYAKFTAATTTSNANFGSIITAQGGCNFKQISTTCTNTTTDFWNATGTNGTVSGTAPTTFNAVGMGLTTADVGKQLRITSNPTQSSYCTTTSGSSSVTGAPPTIIVGQGVTGLGIPPGTTVLGMSGTTATLSNNATASNMTPLTFWQITNAQGGNNNCVMPIQASSSGSAALLLDSGPETGAQLTGGATTQRIVVTSATGAANVFTYPDDLGKIINIDNSTLGQSGAYTIVRLIDPVSGVSFANEYATVNAQMNSMTTSGSITYTNLTMGTNICEVNQVVNGVLTPTEPVFVPESNLTYDLKPAFVTEYGLSWELSDAGSMAPVSGTTYSVTPRQVLPLNSAYYDVIIDNVPSAQVLYNPLVQNNYVPSSATYAYWPFYVTDPYNVVETYLNLIVAAGIQVNFTFT